MNMKNILLFISGLTIGCVSGVLGTKKYFQNKYQKQYENDHAALEEYYHRTDEYSRGNHDEELEDDKNVDTETDSRPGGRMSAEERAEIKEKLNRNWKGTTNYAGMYKNVECQDRSMYDSMVETTEEKIPITDMVCKNCVNYDSEQCNCQIDDEKVNETDWCSDFESIYESPEEQVHNEHQKNKNKPPKIISEEAYSNLPAHIDQEVLYFYTYDEILVDENEEMIDNPEYLVGDALTKYGFIDSDEQVIFVMNYELDTCYEIQKISSSYTETH